MQIFFNEEVHHEQQGIYAMVRTANQNPVAGAEAIVDRVGGLALAAAGV